MLTVIKSIDTEFLNLFDHNRRNSEHKYKSVSDAVDGSLPRLQLMLQPLKKEESNGSDQDSWANIAKSVFRFVGRPETAVKFPQ